MKRLTNTTSWQQLKKHFEEIQKLHLNDFFQEENRAEKFSIEWQDFLFDYSKNRIDKKTIETFISLAEEVNLDEKIKDLFNGKEINWTEKRAVGHWLLRSDLSKTNTSKINNLPSQEIKQTLEKMKIFSEKLISGEKVGNSGKRITDVVNIGIGGSDLGPKMVCHALTHYHKNNINLHFISNVDGHQFQRIVKNLNPETTLFIVASKSFTTVETMYNALSAKQWLCDYYQNENCVNDHVVAISNNVKAAVEFGIIEENIFQMWDFVGGRYSVWSAIGLGICCCYGFDCFLEFLEGARLADNHFKETSFEKNIPFLMAILSIWYNNFFGFETQAIIPYDDSLRYFSSYLQQLEMESNGKSINYFGEKVSYQTGQIIWGGAGTDGQHAYFQLLHQGKKKIPCDFITFTNPVNSLGDHHSQLLSNFFAQTKALAFGVSKDKLNQKISNSDKELSLHKSFDGNTPSSSFLIDKLTPKSLGKLIALYEHKVFIQGIFWQVNSFDQWGVELGKIYAKDIFSQLKNNKIDLKNDSSTTLLMKKFIEKNNLDNL